MPSLRVATVAASFRHNIGNLAGHRAAFDDANIYARAAGYIAKRNVDIGDHVKQGELLAQLAVPDSTTRFSRTKGPSLSSGRRWS